MKTQTFPVLMMVAQLGFITIPASGHPGSGIIADAEGNVYFTATGEWQPGLWRIDPTGKVSRLGATGAHWIALDVHGAFLQADLEGWFQKRVTPWLKRTLLSGSDAVLLQSDGCPTVMHRDRGLYYVKGLELARLSPDGKVTVVGQGLKETVDKLGGIKGLASDEAGTIFVTCPSAILSIQPDGKFTTVLHPVRIQDCQSYLPPNNPPEYAPYLTGLTVGPKGIIYAAATGCRRVVRISPEGQLTVVLKADAPWSPTGVAIHGESIYVLEHTNANDDTHEWQPRVRKLTRDGKVSTLVTISRESR